MKSTVSLRKMGTSACRNNCPAFCGSVPDKKTAYRISISAHPANGEFLAILPVFLHFGWWIYKRIRCYIKIFYRTKMRFAAKVFISPGNAKRRQDFPAASSWCDHRSGKTRNRGSFQSSGIGCCRKSPRSTVLCQMNAGIHDPGLQKMRRTDILLSNGGCLPRKERRSKNKFLLGMVRANTFPHSGGTPFPDLPEKGPGIP